MDRTEKNYGNYAFISYKREDEHWAKWLQRKLERYRLPAVIRSELPSAPKFIRPVFRDNTDLTGGVLADSLRRELDDSRFLIVICSPAATQSEWVNKEIQTFINEGRADHIIPFVVAGKPHAANPTEECFPKALRELSAENELLGINVSELGREKAFIRLVATMLGVKFDTLWQRHRRRARNLRIAAGVVAAVALLFGLFVYDYNRSTYAYFMDYTDCFGLPEGIVEISRDKARHRRGTFEFRYERTPFGEPGAYSWRLAEVAYVNGSLRPIDIDSDDLERGDRSAILRLDYDKETGKVLRHNYCDTKGKVKLRHVLSRRNGVDATVADLIHSHEQLGVGYASALSEDGGREKSSIVRYVYTRDAAGHITACTFHANNDSRVEKSLTANADGIFGYRYTLDSLGRRTSGKNCGIGGEPVADKKGVAELRYKYDSFGNVAEVSIHDLSGALTPGAELWAVARAETDADGRYTAIRFFDAEDNPTLNKTEAVAARLIVPDDRGNATEISYIDTNGTPCNVRSGYNRRVCKYDSRGNCTETAVFNADGTPGFTEEGAHRYKRSFDGQDNLTEELYYGADGNLTTISTGMAGQRFKYDSRGNCIEVLTLGIDGKPAANKDGVAIVRFKFDERDFCVETSYFSSDGKPVHNKDGIAVWTRTFDDRGNVLSESYCDADGKAAPGPDGVCSVVMEYDENGNRMSRTGYNADGSVTYDKDGVYITRYTHDAMGHTTSVNYYDAENRPVLSIDGTAGFKNEFDRAGNRISTANIDTVGTVVSDNHGIAVYRYKYDGRRNRTETGYFDEAGQPAVDAEGIHRRISVYDKRGNIVETSACDVDGRCVTDKNGEMHGFAEYDSRDRAVRLTNRDDNGNLVGSAGGCAIIENTYDNHGNLVGKRFYGADGRPVLSPERYASCTIEYNGRNQPVRTSYFGTDGAPCEIFEGVYIYTKEYDEYGRSIAENYLGRSGEPVFNKEYGCFRREKAYDSRGNLVKSLTLDTAGNPCMNSGCYSWYTAKYDDYGNEIEISYFGPDGQPVLTSEGIAMRRTDYDNKGKIIKESNYGPDGKPALSAQGWAVHELIRDNFGNVIEQSYFGTDNEPVMPLGYHREVRTCDRYGNVVSARYFDKDGNAFGDFTEVPVVSSVRNPDFIAGLPINSFILSYNDWMIGDTRQSLENLTRRLRSKPKTVTVLTPEGEVRTFSVSGGLLGVSWNYRLLERSQIADLRSRLRSEAN